MKSRILFVIVLSLLSELALSQNNMGVLDGVYVKENTITRQVIPYPYLREADVMWSKRVWRLLDLNEKMNLPFRYEAEDDNGSQMFINMLLKAVNSGEVTAFADDRFTTPLKLEEINSQMGGTYDTIAKRDINDPSIITEYVITKSSFRYEKVYKGEICSPNDGAECIDIVQEYISENWSLTKPVA